MKKTPCNRRLLLLVEPRSGKTPDLREWLRDLGYVAWRANDISHAMEELSDFTVRNRPDVVMLEATPVFECLENLRATFCPTEGPADVSVVGISETHGPVCSEQFFAHDLDQLRILINREAGPLSC